ncbi:hypothetical protein [Guptibacillus hwajinpoensis]|uniref:hypothetical protein n=1 Tax=Guptibacillus hwajinpoensis TaxID=208199 RepID=UPI003CFE3F49
MNTQSTITNVINTLSSYYKKQESFKNIFSNQSIMVKVGETFDEEIFELIDSVLDMLGLPRKEDVEVNGNNHSIENGLNLSLEAQLYKEGFRDQWERKICTNLIIEAAKNKIYLESAVKLVSQWQKLNQYIKEVEKHDCFYYIDLLKKHS